MKIILVFAFTVGLLSCAEDHTSNAPAEIVGQWQLIELYGDIGDGSGKFTPVESDKMIIFASKGNYISNGSTCMMGTTTGVLSKGDYNWTERVLMPEDCEYGERELSYQIEEPYLFLYYPCIEGCVEKYVKLRNKK